MPPKKKKSAPLVVGTVSTRSTRRESIVNIKIIPKINKATKPSLLKNTTKSTPNTKCEEEESAVAQSPENTSSKILEILKDWSDDENSQDDIILVPSARNTSDMLADDQQSLIDILEGKQSELQDVTSTHKIDFRSNYTSSDPKTSCQEIDTIMANRVVNINSPKVDESEVIEEIVVDDDSIIVVLPEEQMEDCNNRKDVSANVQELSKQSILKSIVNAEEDNTSVTSEDTSQSMVTVQDEYVSDNNVINLSDTSSSNYEIVEEQVVCDSSEPIIIECLDTLLTENRSQESESLVTKSEINLSENQKDDTKEKRVFSSTEPNFQAKSSFISLEQPKTSFTEQKDTKIDIKSFESDGNTLCQKMRESMQISQDLNTNSRIDFTPDKLQDEISKMSIKSRKEIYKNSVTADNNQVRNTKHTVLLDNTDDKIGLNRSSASKNKKIKKFDSDSDMSPKISPRTSPKTNTEGNAVTELDNKHIRRSTRKKTIEIEIQSECFVDEDSNLLNVSSNHTINEKKASTDNTNIEKIGMTSEFDLIKDEIRLEAVSKADSKKVELLDKMKMDIGTENKTPEAENYSTSNESTQDQVNFKVSNHNKQLENISSTSEREKDISSAAVLVNRKSPKVNKSKAKKDCRKDINTGASKMDTDYFIAQQSYSQPLRSQIDATIDEVLRKYTHEEAESSKDYIIFKDLNTSKDNKTRSTKDLKKKKDGKPRKDEKNGESSEEVRRSDRIKTILPVKKKSHGLVRSKSESGLSFDAENSDSNSYHNDSDKPTPTASPQLSKTEKTRSKAKSLESLRPVSLSPSNVSPELPKPIAIKADKSGQAEIEARLKTFTHLKENQYKTDRQVCKEAREMICDCYLAEEDIQRDEYGCGEDCLNRLLMIECGELCQVGGRCTNKKFQKSHFAPVEVFKTEKKGLGLRAAANIAYGEFILEYIGEVLNPDEFDKRAEVYSKDKNIHFYFMSLRADAIIDATMKGNISRFINHSCDPNAETQKWTVNGELRIGFFSTRTILAGEEITFDYRFQRYGKEAQKCYCEAANCRGWLGERPVESEEEDEEEDEESSKVPVQPIKADVEVSHEISGEQPTGAKIWPLETLLPEKMDTDDTTTIATDVAASEKASVVSGLQETPKKVIKKKPRKEMLYDDFDQLNGDIEMLVTTGLKNQAHTLKLSRLMVRAKDLDQRKKLLRVLRRGELPCRRLFLDYHGLRLMHGYMIDAQQLTSEDVKVVSSKLEVIQTKLELLQTLAVLPIQNKTMLIESKVLPAVKKWAKNEDIVEDSDHKEVRKSPEETGINYTVDPVANEKIDEIKFLATKLLEEWANLKESFRIPKKQRIEQMKEHEKEANRKFMESSYAQEKEPSRKHDQRYRTWSRYKSERETNKRSGRHDDKDRPSAEYLKISKHERRKLFALQMELKEEERRLKQREMWRQHEMNCMMIGADPRFTAPFDPTKGFQYIWNPSLGQWQALPVPASQNQGMYNSPVTSQGVLSFNVPPPHKQTLLGPYSTPMMSVAGIPGASQYPGIQSTLPPLVPGLATSAMANQVPGITPSLSGISSNVPGMSGTIHGLPGIAGSLPGITQPPLPALSVFQEVKNEDPSQVKFAGPIPPPAKLPPKWRCAKDKFGRPYYYHVKLRRSQWEPPPLPQPLDESTESSSSETSSGSSSDSSSESETDDEIDDAKLLLEVKKQMEITPKAKVKSIIPDYIKKEVGDSVTPSPEIKLDSDNDDELNILPKDDNKSEPISSIDIRLKEQFNLDSNETSRKKRRIGLCQEIIISPRTEEDRKQFKEDLKRYRATKEKLKRQKEQMLQQAKKKLKTTASGEEVKQFREKRSSKSTSKSRMKEMKEWNDEHAKKIKEVFRSTMATTVVSVLNAYRKPDCKESKITNTEDFKHLARKLTHFVMLKEIKHLSSIEELVCTDNVKAKAREYIRKYMSKFGEFYQKRHDEPDFKD